jgi:hypothetical protein
MGRVSQPFGSRDRVAGARAGHTPPALPREDGRLLKPGGCAFFFVPDDCLGPIDEPEHVIKFTAWSLRACLEKRFRDVEQAADRATP